jgi:hypothetical protein
MNLDDSGASLKLDDHASLHDEIQPMTPNNMILIGDRNFTFGFE